MRRSRWWVLVLLAMLTAVLHLLWLRFMLYSAKSIPLEGWYSGVANLVICLPSIYLGVQVKHLKKREKTWMGPVGAARVAALGLSLSHLGALLGGYLAAKVILLAGNLENESLAAWMGPGVFGLVTAAVMLGTGLWIEHICTVDPKGPPEAPSSSVGLGVV